MEYYISESPECGVHMCTLTTQEAQRCYKLLNLNLELLGEYPLS